MFVRDVRVENARGMKNNRAILENNKHDLEVIDTVYKHPDVTDIAEFIKNKLYFATLISGRKEARSTPNIYFFTIDDELVYNNFYNDFGPLNIACLYKYCCKVNQQLKNPANEHKQIVHCTSKDEEKRANAAFLIASYAILYLHKSPKEAYKILFAWSCLPLKPFQDASMGSSSVYNIRLSDCLSAIQKAASLGFFDFDDFDLAEYEKYEDMRNGDLNWMVPRKFLAFVGPSMEAGTSYHPPERYIDYFLRNGIVAVVRLNRKTYDASRFTDAGIAHYDMFMPDGTVPPTRILNQFFRLAESTNAPIAIHCKAGLGRTGSLIAAYLIKHYKLAAREAIAWVRICRPGSVIGHQQAWLEKMESNLFDMGQRYKLKYYGDKEATMHHNRGIYSIAEKMENIRCSPIIGYNHKCRNLGDGEESENRERKPKKCDGNNSENRRALTQGDRLNEIKMHRYKLHESSESRRDKTFPTAATTDSVRGTRRKNRV